MHGHLNVKFQLTPPLPLLPPPYSPFQTYYYYYYYYYYSVCCGPSKRSLLTVQN